MRPAALIMGSLFVALGIWLALSGSRTLVWVLLVIGGLLMVYYALRRRRAIDFEPRRTRLWHDGQKQLTKDATEIVARVSGDPAQASRTWVILAEAAEGGWGIAGTAFGRQEFAELAARAAAARTPATK